MQKLKSILICLSLATLRGLAHAGTEPVSNLSPKPTLRELAFGDFHGRVEMKDTQGRIDSVDSVKNKQSIKIPNTQYFSDCEDGPDCSYFWITNGGVYTVDYVPSRGEFLYAVYYASCNGPRGTSDKLCIRLAGSTPVSFRITASDDGHLKVDNDKPHLKVAYASWDEDCDTAFQDDNRYAPHEVP